MTRSRSGAACPRDGLKLVLFIHLALSPVLFYRGTLDVFEFNKLSLLLLTAIASMALFLTGRTPGNGASSGPPRSPRALAPERGYHHPIVLGTCWLLLSSLLSTLTSTSPRTSFWGAHESFGGLITIAAYAALFFVTRSAIDESKDARHFLVAPVLGAAAASTYGLVQLAGLDPISWSQTATLGSYPRVFSTMGHPNFLAAYLVMSLPFGLWLCQRAWSARLKLSSAVFVCWTAASMGMVVLSFSRGGWLASAAVMAVLGWVHREKFHHPRAYLVAGTGVGLLLFVLGLGVLLAPKIGVVSHLTERIRSFGESAPRLHMWKAALELFWERPWVGHGPDSFQLAFQSKRPLEFALMEAHRTPTRAHNELLHLAATQGSVGLMGGVLLTYGLVNGLLRARGHNPADTRVLRSCIGASLAGFFVQSLFSFTVVGLGVFFVTLAAILSRLQAGVERSATAITRPASLPAWLQRGSIISCLLMALALGLNFRAAATPSTPFLFAAWVVIAACPFVVALACLHLERTPPLIEAGDRDPERSAVSGAARVRVFSFAWLATWSLAAITAVTVVFRPYAASVTCRLGDETLTWNPEQALAYYQAARSLDPHRPIYPVKLGAGAVAAAARTADPLRALALAQEAFQGAIDLVPGYAHHHLGLARVRTDLARHGVGTAESAFRSFDQAILLDPNNLFFPVEAATAALSLDEPRTASRYARQALELLPTYGPALSQLGHAALLRNEADEAADFFLKALGGEWHEEDQANLVTHSNLSAALLLLDRLEEAEQVARDVLARAPAYIDARWNLAQALEGQGRVAEAAAEYRQVLAREPAHAGALAALQALARLPANNSR